MCLLKSIAETRTIRDILGSLSNFAFLQISRKREDQLAQICLIILQLVPIR